MLVKISYLNEKSFLRLENLTLEDLLKSIEDKFGSGQPKFSTHDNIVINEDNVIEFIDQFQFDVNFVLFIDVDKGEFLVKNVKC